MNDQYLWDGSGKPDPEIVRLEKLLGKLRHGGPVRTAKRTWLGWMALAAALILMGILSIPLYLNRPFTNWKTANGHRIRAGQLIETGGQHETRIEAEDTGQVTIDPHSRFRLIAATGNEQRFDLRRGTIHAFIWAPPGKFVVDTPSSKTIDLGCRYSLQVSDNGQGLLNVEFGWVAFEKNHVESFIPAGAACVTRPKLGPGTPYFTDAPKALIGALARFDEGDLTALPVAMGAARERDALSLWHLILRTNGEQRGEVFDRLAALVRLPDQVTRQAVLAGDQPAIDGAWNALGLGATDWWRKWKRTW